MYKYPHKNIRPFSAICDNNFGREVIYTNALVVDENNIINELGKALPIHYQNAEEIEYLNRYYAGDQPILYRRKENRPEVNNKIVSNLALYIVETKASEIAGEPIQYILRGTEKEKSEEISKLNAIMEGEDKACDDIEICRWRSICGTAYRYIGNDEGNGSLLDETSFYLAVENPMTTFVVYHSNNRPAFSCQIREDEEGREVFYIFTNSKWFVIRQDKIVNSGTNGNGAIPVIEYPNNSRRLSDIEITIFITDEINRMASDRANGIEQFVSAWVKFVNCEIDSETYAKMRQEGALVVKSNNGTENKADVDVMTSELNQSETQVAVDDLLDKLLLVQGMSNRQTSSSSGDTQGAVLMRNGYYDKEKRSEMSEPIFKRAERQTLKIILNRLRITDGFSLMPSDVEVKISRTKMDNIYTKVESLKLMLDMGIFPDRAIKTVGIWSDPEQVAIESRERMNVLYPTTPEEVGDANVNSVPIGMDNNVVNNSLNDNNE